ncbi:hypothetical protein TWF694_005887 [Orbilia ellipsospora]|uniref:Essential protein Yae1 N-terminal domain-containing protein n=1 Tax=Orbilia ellipsospora TaxID=2528407 RepID=A0AAV9WTL1_9PEZI
MADEEDIDIFDAVLNLEEDYYAQGHLEGTKDGATAGRLEGRAFGIEKGFEKYLTLGLLKGRTKVWSSRLSPSKFNHNIQITNPRHIKHITLLQTLTTSPPIRNEEDDVEEVDDRIRRGKAKVKILETTLRESVSVDVPQEEVKGTKPTRNTSGVAVAGGSATGLETEFEDFKIRR